MRMKYLVIILLVLFLVLCVQPSYSSEEVPEITYDDKNNKYIWEATLSTLDIVISKPPCVDRNDNLVLRKYVFVNSSWIPEKVDCAKKFQCIEREGLKKANFSGLFGYCSELNVFQSQPALCEKLNGVRAQQTNMCYTAMLEGSAVKLEEYMLTLSWGYTVKFPENVRLQLNTSEVPIVPKDVSIYFENIDNAVEHSQSVYQPDISYLSIFEIPFVEVSIKLEYSHRLLLTCYNCDYIGLIESEKAISCHTTDDYGDKVNVHLTPFKIINSSVEIFSVEQFRPEDEGFRQYSCEAYTIFDAERVESEKTLVGFQEPSTLSFAFFIKSSNTSKTEFIEQFKTVLKVKYARIFSINDSGKMLLHALVSNTTHTIDSFSKSIREKYDKDFLGTVNSTDYCYSEPFLSTRWRTVRRGETSFLNDSRVRNKEGGPMRRKCIGTFEYGAKWEEIKDHSVINETDVNDVVVELNEEILKPSWKMENNSVADLAHIFEKLDTNKETISLKNVESIFKICNKLMEQPRQFFKMPSETNIVLSSIENIFDETFTRKEISFDENGVNFTVKEQFSVFSIDPQKFNVSGLAFYKKPGKNRQNIGNVFFDYITVNQTMESFKSQSDPDLDIATYFPEDLLNFLNPTKNTSFRIILKIYNNDIFFQPTENLTANRSVADKVISISAPGFSAVFEDHVLPIMFRVHGSNPGCYYWNYDNWLDRGIESSPTSSVFLYSEVHHLVPFTRITEITDAVPLDSGHYKIMNYITQVGLSLSLFGVVGILVTAFYNPGILFSRSSKNMLHITISLLIEIILFFISESGHMHHVRESCMIVGGLLHYIILVNFAWMTINAVHNWWIWYFPFSSRMDRDDNRHKIPIFLVFGGWVVPIIPAVTSGMFTVQQKGLDFCFLSGNVKIWGFLVPMYVMFAVIVICFVLLVVEFKRMLGKTINSNQSKTQNFKLVITNIRLLIFAIGIPWCFGALHLIFAGDNFYAVFFAYSFNIVVPLQGFFMFLFLIALNPKARCNVRPNVIRREEVTEITRLNTMSGMTRFTRRNTNQASMTEGVNTEQTSTARVMRLNSQRVKWYKDPNFRKK